MYVHTTFLRKRHQLWRSFRGNLRENVFRPYGHLKACRMRSVPNTCEATATATATSHLSPFPLLSDGPQQRNGHTPYSSDSIIFNHLMLYRTLPSWKIRSSLLSVVTSWKLAPFSFAKNRSGFQIESNMDGSRSRESSGYSL